MRNLFHIAKNIINIMFFKKKTNIIIYCVLPVIFMLVSVLIYSHSGNGNVLSGYKEHDNTIVESDMIKVIKGSDKLKVTNMDNQDVKSSIVNQKVDCVIIIPKGFEKSIKNGEIKNVQLISIKGESVTAWVKTFVDYYIKNIADISKASEGNEDAFNKMYNAFKKQDVSLKIKSIKDKAYGDYVTSQSMGFLVMFLLFGSTTVANSILVERNQNTYYRIFCAPVSTKSYIGGNIIAGMVMIFLQIVFAVSFMRYIFHIDPGMPLSVLFILLMDFGLVSVAFGVFLVSFSKNSRQLDALATMIITPTSMVSGCFWPLNIMPNVLQKIAHFLPQTWVLDAINKSQSSKPASQIALDMLIVFLFAAVFFVIGIYNMRTSKSVQSFA